MSNPQKLYSLHILFDGTQVTLEELKEKTKNAMYKYLQEIEFNVESASSSGLLLKIRGSLEVVDNCHQEINNILLNQSQLKFVRLLDEAGDEVRHQAYSMVAEIEQRFRGFISQAIVEVAGFDWWDTLAPTNIRNKVQPIQKQHQSDGTQLNPLECTQFDDLIELITAEVSEWSDNKSLSVTDLLELLADCNSIVNFREKLEAKIKKFSYWDIFEHYFQDKEQWKKVKKSIQYVVNERHKVMHHRPIRLGVLKALSSKKEEIFALLDAKRELSAQERTEAQQEMQNINSLRMKDLINRLSPTLQGIAKDLANYNSQEKFNKGIQQQISLQEKIAKSLGISNSASLQDLLKKIVVNLPEDLEFPIRKSYGQQDDDLH